MSTKPDVKLVQTACCEACGVKVAAFLTDVDHKIPRFIVHNNHASNLQRLCLNCHRSKTLFECRVIQPIKAQLDRLVEQLQQTGVVETGTTSDVLQSLIRVIRPLQARHYLEGRPSGHVRKRKHTSPRWTPEEEKDLRGRVRQLHYPIQTRRSKKQVLDWKRLRVEHNLRHRRHRTVAALKLRFNQLDT